MDLKDKLTCLSRLLFKSKIFETDAPNEWPGDRGVWEIVHLLLPKQMNGSNEGV